MKPVVKWTEAHFDNETQELTLEVRFTLVDDDIPDAALKALRKDSAFNRSSFASYMPFSADGREEPVRIYPFSTARFTLTLDELRAHLLPLAEPDPNHRAVSVTPDATDMRCPLCSAGCGADHNCDTARRAVSANDRHFAARRSVSGGEATDDERESLIDVLIARHTGTDLGRTMAENRAVVGLEADAILAAGYRRSVSATPDAPHG